MKKIISYITIVVAACATLSGCMPEKADTALEYKGPTEVEFKNFTLGQLTAVLNLKGVSTVAADAQTDTTHTVLINVRTTDSLLVQLVGPQVSTPTVITYAVRATSTAIEGTHYNFSPANARTVTIPANSSSAYILINPVANSIPVVGNSVTLIVDLIGSGAILPSHNFKSFYDKLKR